jgi:hypothetical protein
VAWTVSLIFIKFKSGRMSLRPQSLTNEGAPSQYNIYRWESRSVQNVFLGSSSNKAIVSDPILSKLSNDSGLIPISFPIIRTIQPKSLLIYFYITKSLCDTTNNKTGNHPALFGEIIVKLGTPRTILSLLVVLPGFQRRAHSSHARCFHPRFSSEKRINSPDHHQCFINTVIMKFIVFPLFVLATLAPSRTTLAQEPDSRCEKNEDCEVDVEYCAGGTCLPFGSCTQRSDCFNPSNVFPVIECFGVLDCTDNQCGVICGDQQCPDNVMPASCDPNNLPCDVVDPCEEAVSCYNEFCGEECRAVFYDAADNVDVCEGGPQEEPGPVETAACATNQECLELFGGNITGYCSQGVCMPGGSCVEDIDCQNPSNVYNTVFCVGVTTCNKNGLCETTCGDPCEQGVEQVNCFADPCLDFQFGCPGAASCASDYCGGCNAVLFDEAGFRMDQDACNGEAFNSTLPPTSSSTSTTNDVSNTDAPAVCTSDADCAATALERSSIEGM